MCFAFLLEDSEIFSGVRSTTNPLNDSFESVMGTLGLTDRKPVPDPIVFEESDPLGISLMVTPNNSLTTDTGQGLSLDGYFSTKIIQTSSYRKSSAIIRICS